MRGLRILAFGAKIMIRVTFGDVLYRRLFPVVVLICIAGGVMAFAAEAMHMSLNCFIAVFFGVRLDNHIALRRQAEAEAAAAERWQRLRGPVIAG